jgi:hypothetical protein
METQQSNLGYYITGAVTILAVALGAYLVFNKMGCTNSVEPAPM